MWDIITKIELFRYFPFGVITVPVASMLAVVVGLKIFHLTKLL